MSLYCTFYLHGLLFGIDVLRVQEIVRGRSMVPVPLSLPVVRGLMNLRGQLVTAIDLRQRLDMPPAEDSEGTMHVVLRNPGDLVSLVVDRMGDVVDVDETQVQRPPETLSGIAAELTAGAWPMDDRLLLLLHLDRTVAL